MLDPVISPSNASAPLLWVNLCTTLGLIQTPQKQTLS